MNIIDSIIKFVFSILFLLKQYTNNETIENYLNKIENYLINKHLSNVPIPPCQIPILYNDNLTKKSFEMLSNNYQTPVLIKGYLKDSNAVKKWNFDYLKNIIGNYPSNYVKFDDKFEIKNMTFSEFYHKTKNESQPLYLNNNHTIISTHPDLFDDLQPYWDNLLNRLNNQYLVHIVNLFIGYTDKNSKTTGSNMHCGGSGNFFCMIKGEKHWTLIDPKYSYLLKGRVSESGIHGQTLFDMPDTSLEELPEIFTNIPRYEIKMEAGDLLWNPPWWWHRITNSTGESIGVAVRHNKVTSLNIKNNLLYTLSGYTYLVYNSITIGLYEMMFNKGKMSCEEKNDGNVLYQIDKLIKKYPKSYNLNDILD